MKKVSAILELSIVRRKLTPVLQLIEAGLLGIDWNDWFLIHQKLEKHKKIVKICIQVHTLCIHILDKCLNIALNYIKLTVASE